MAPHKLMPMTGVPKRGTQVADSVVSYIHINRGAWVTAVVRQFEACHL